MLSKCANPACPNTFRYLRDGKLFLIECAATPAKGTSDTDRRVSGKSRTMDYAWLCSSCCRDMTIYVGSGGGIRVAASSEGQVRARQGTANVAKHDRGIAAQAASDQRGGRIATQSHRHSEWTNQQQNSRAEHELGSFVSAVAKLYGPEEARLSAQDWLEELELSDSPPSSPGESWRAVTIAASIRLARRLSART